MTAASTHTWLPPEIWSRVLYWATYCSARELRDLLEVPLFDGITHHEAEAFSFISMKTKVALAVVCKEWHVLSEQYLFEELRFKHDKSILADVLEASKEQCPQGIGKGRHVKRILLPFSQRKSAGYGHGRHWADEETSRIIKCCPNLLALSRYYPLRFSDYESDDDYQQDDENDDERHPMSMSKPNCCSTYDPPFPFLKRLDWNNGPAKGNPPGPVICAVPSAFWSTQHLEVLSLAGDNYFWSPLELQSLSGHVILLPRLHTLRIASVHIFGVPGVTDYRLALPSLRRIILDRSASLYRLIECVVRSPSDDTKPDVKALEIGVPHWRFLRSDYISTLIRYFPTAESLHYPIFFTRPLRWRRLRVDGHPYPPHRQPDMFNSIRNVGLHAELHPEDFRRHNSNQTDEDLEVAIWSHLYAHARALLGSASPAAPESRLPGVRSVVLHGDSWLPFVIDSRFQFIMDLARERGTALIAEHPRVANALQAVLLEHR